MDIVGVSHPIPTEFAMRIYNENKNVFVGKSFLGRVQKGDKFIIYESQGEKAFTGWADIKSIGKMKSKTMLSKFKGQMMINKDEFKEYTSQREIMNYIEFENFELFNSPVKPPRFIGIRGKYISSDELNDIISKKD